MAQKPSPPEPKNCGPWTSDFDPACQPKPLLNPDGTNSDELPVDLSMSIHTPEKNRMISLPVEGTTSSVHCSWDNLGSYPLPWFQCLRTTYYLCDGQNPYCNNPNACGIDPFQTQDIVASHTGQFPRCSGNFFIITPNLQYLGVFPNRDVQWPPTWNWIDILNHNIGDFNLADFV
jgi:hypothetical protein